MNGVLRRALVPSATFALALLGTAAVAVAVTLSLTSGDGEPGAVESTVPSAPASPGSTAPAADATVADAPDPDWVAATASSTGLPERALRAYAGASILVTRSHPDCGLGWNTLAAIGAVESEHGGIDGGQIAEDGVVSPPIIGIPLDGDDVARVRDTDDGELDEDTTWDRAVGPLQIIPSTWSDHAVDGTGDGVADVHNIDDAALTAATYLCAASNDLTTAEGWTAAIAAYNVGTEYRDRVAGVASTYAKAVTD